jgi:hypothetical protein
MSANFLRFYFVLLPLSAFAAYQPHDDRPRWSFEYHFGGTYNFELPLTIVQAGYPDIYIKRAIYETEPFTSPHYWNWRFTKRFETWGLSFEAIHHKIYLKNKPAEVERFGISHGYNMLILSYIKQYPWFNLCFGGGTVLAHPESTVRGMKWPEGPGFDLYGYELGGYVLNFGIAHQVRIYKRFYVSTEAKLTFSQVEVPIVDGHANVNSLALQLIFGPGIDFGYRR